ncbi:MAG: hypothetical protein JXB19_01690 [Bacteroidales bacterium]|nr:hypothetical protein [Bacteroidales bacterium]
METQQFKAMKPASCFGMSVNLCMKVKFFLKCMAVMCCFMPFLYGGTPDVDEQEASVMTAYELRINGKADEAETMLSELLKNDSTDALAYFELARTKHHIFLGSGQYTQEKWTEVMHALQQAVRYAPGNEIYTFYCAYASFFNAYISMMMQSPDAAEDVAHACDAFQAVLNLDPDCFPARLYLVDIYGYLPENMGGDKDKAGNIAADLNKKNRIFGAMASAKLLPDDADHVSYWQNIIMETGNNPHVLEELGRAYLLASDTENGTKYFQDAIQADVAKRYLYMNLARYHLLSSQQNPDNQAEHLEEAEKLVNTYLSSKPELPPALKAYSNGMLALIKMVGKDNEGSKKFQETAALIDPYYSKGTGMAPEMLYCKPDEVIIRYSSFFMPF